jgi:hypothetical protein
MFFQNLFHVWVTGDAKLRIGGMLKRSKPSLSSANTTAFSISCHYFTPSDDPVAWKAKAKQRLRVGLSFSKVKSVQPFEYGG